MAPGDDLCIRTRGRMQLAFAAPSCLASVAASRYPSSHRGLFSRQQQCSAAAVPSFLDRMRMPSSLLLEAVVASFLSLVLASASAGAEEVPERMLPLQFPFLVQKLSLYQQENPTTAIFVVPPQSGHGGSFGALSVIDQPLTAGVDVASTEVGRARGLAVFSDDLEVGKTGAPELVWTADINDPRPGGYGNGTISLRGYNQLATALREVSIVGGTGRFRLAQGWATVSTVYRNDTTRYSTQAWTFYVYLPPFTVQDFHLNLHESS